MKLMDYIKGSRKGKTAHELEQQSQSDPFLADAIDGFDTVEGDHARRIAELRKQVKDKTVPRTTSLRYLWRGIAALLVLGVGSLGYILLNRDPVISEVRAESKVVFTLYLPPQAAESEKQVQATVADLVADAAPVQKKESRERPGTRAPEMAAESALSTEDKDLEEVLAALSSSDEEKKKSDETVPDKKQSATRQDAIVPSPQVVLTQAEATEQRNSSRSAAAVHPEKNKPLKVRVVTNDGRPLNGASVRLRDERTQAITDANGEVSFPSYRPYQQVDVQYIGYKPQSLQVDSSGKFVIRLSEDERLLNENLVEEFDSIQNSKKEKKIKPVPLGGQKAYEQYLSTQLIRPTDAECKNKKGTVTLIFSTDEKGRPYNIRVKKGLCPSCDREAIRLVNAGTRWSDEGTDIELGIHF